MDPVIIGGSIFLTVIVVVLLVLNARASSAPVEQIRGLMSSAAVARQGGNFEQALILYERALGLLDGASSTDEILVCECLVHASVCMDRIGKVRESREFRQRLLAIFESALNRRDSAMLTEIDYLCSRPDFGASTAQVAEFYERLMAFREKTVSPNSTDFINTVMIYSILLRQLGEKQLADDLEQHAQKLRRGGSNEVEIQDEGDDTAGGGGAPPA